MNSHQVFFKDIEKALFCTLFKKKYCFTNTDHPSHVLSRNTSNNLSNELPMKLQKETQEVETSLLRNLLSRLFTDGD